MLSLSCCPNHCPSPDVSSAIGSVYPHSCVWDCAGDGDSSENPFYKHFQLLPYEMKIHCLSFCTFHALVNTELWLQDTDLLHYKKHVMQEHHIVRSRACSINRDLKLYDLNKNISRVSVGFVGNNVILSTGPQKDRTHQQKIYKRFGSVNRYPSCYYRRCSHFDYNQKEIELTKEVITERLKRLYNRVGTRASVKRVETVLRKAARSQTHPRRYYRGKMYRPANPYRLNHPIHVDLQPGVYYWELVNYNWEEALARLGGDVTGNRQRHFFLDPNDSSHVEAESEEAIGSRNKRMYMSLMYRRITHPTSEVDDRFTTIARIFTAERACANRDPTSIYFTFCTKYPTSDCFQQNAYNVSEGSSSSSSSDDDDPYSLEYLCMIYQHVLTPNVGVRVYKRVNTTPENIVVYYRVEIPSNARLYTLDSNSNALRMNFYIDVQDMSFEQKESYGSSIVNTVYSNLDIGYAFMPYNISLADRHSQDVCHEVFNLLNT